MPTYIGPPRLVERVPCWRDHRPHCNCRVTRRGCPARAQYGPVGLTFTVKPRRRFWRLRTLLALGVVVAVGAGVFVVTRKSGEAAKPALPARQVDAFLGAWSRGATTGMAAQLDAAPPKLGDTAMSLIKTAPGSRAKYTRTTLVRDPIGDGATATYHARVDVAGFGPLEWDGVLP